MSTASRDQNFVTGKMAVLNTDTVQGQNLVPIAVDAVTGAIQVNEDDGISFTMVPVSPRDQNYVNCWMFEGTDGQIYPAVADSNGKLLISR